MIYVVSPRDQPRAAGESLEREAVDRVLLMVSPTLANTVSAIIEDQLPCATMCAFHRQRPPAPRRPRLLAFQCSDLWMAFDKFDKAGRAGA